MERSAPIREVIEDLKIALFRREEIGALFTNDSLQKNLSIKTRECIQDSPPSFSYQKNDETFTALEVVLQVFENLQENIKLEDFQYYPSRNPHLLHAEDINKKPSNSDEEGLINYNDDHDLESHMNSSINSSVKKGVLNNDDDDLNNQYSDVNDRYEKFEKGLYRSTNLKLDEKNSESRKGNMDLDDFDNIKKDNSTIFDAMIGDNCRYSTNVSKSFLVNNSTEMQTRQSSGNVASVFLAKGENGVQCELEMVNSQLKYKIKHLQENIEQMKEELNLKSEENEEYQKKVTTINRQLYSNIKRCISAESKIAFFHYLLLNDNSDEEQLVIKEFKDYLIALDKITKMAEKRSPDDHVLAVPLLPEKIQEFADSDKQNIAEILESVKDLKSKVTQVNPTVVSANTPQAIITLPSTQLATNQTPNEQFSEMMRQYYSSMFNPLNLANMAAMNPYLAPFPTGFNQFSPLAYDQAQAMRQLQQQMLAASLQGTTSATQQNLLPNFGLQSTGSLNAPNMSTLPLASNTQTAIQQQIAQQPVSQHLVAQLPVAQQSVAQLPVTNPSVTQLPSSNLPIAQMPSVLSQRAENVHGQLSQPIDTVVLDHKFIAQKQSDYMLSPKSMMEDKSQNFKNNSVLSSHNVNKIIDTGKKSVPSVRDAQESNSVVNASPRHLKAIASQPSNMSRLDSFEDDFTAPTASSGTLTNKEFQNVIGGLDALDDFKEDLSVHEMPKKKKNATESLSNESPRQDGAMGRKATAASIVPGNSPKDGSELGAIINRILDKYTQLTKDDATYLLKMAENKMKALSGVPVNIILDEVDHIVTGLRPTSSQDNAVRARDDSKSSKQQLSNVSDVKRSILYKTVICSKYKAGTCPHNDNPADCGYAHGSSELKQTRTRLCKNFILGNCSYGNECLFLHNADELLRQKKETYDADDMMDSEQLENTEGENYDWSATANYKTTLCIFYKKGFCQNGTICRYAHGENELRTMPKIFKGTGICLNICNGIQCPYGDQCPFSHDLNDLDRYEQHAKDVDNENGSDEASGDSSTMITYKSTLCKYFAQGYCSGGMRCRFAHGTSDIRPLLSQKDVVCRSIISSKPCHYGDKCLYSHDLTSAYREEQLKERALLDYGKTSRTAAAHELAWQKAYEFIDDGPIYSNDECCICTEAMLSTTFNQTLQCGHQFHSQCIREWLIKHDSTCPICRDYALLPDEYPPLK